VANGAKLWYKAPIKQSMTADGAAFAKFRGSGRYLSTIRQEEERSNARQNMATIEDLNKVEGKAELVNGEIVEFPPAGDDPGYASGEIFAHLRSMLDTPAPVGHTRTALDSMRTFRIGKPSAQTRRIMSGHARVCGSWKGRLSLRSKSGVSMITA
jgi:hypothetical protein